MTEIVTPGIDGKLLRTVTLLTSDDELVTEGPTRYFLFRVMSDKSLESWDTLSGSWTGLGGNKLGAAGAMEHQIARQSGEDADTGIWVVDATLLLALGALEPGRIYLERIENDHAFPRRQTNRWQFLPPYCRL